MLRTKINGKWVTDPQKDYSNGQTKPTNTNAQVALLQAQVAYLANLIKGISQCTKMVDAKILIKTAKTSYPH